MDEVLKKFKAIIFDMDGTILDTERVWHMVTCKVLEEYGIDVTNPAHQPFLHSLSGIGLPEAVTAIKDYFKIDRPTDQLISYKQQLANDHFAEHISFIGGFEKFHNILKENNIPSGIATNATLSNLEELTRKFSLNKFFGNNLYCVAHVNNKSKPDPSLFLHTAAMLGAKPEECVVFEDSIYGFQAAQAAGMKCIAIKNNINVNHRHYAQEEIDNYDQALEALRKLSK